jgi:hypothetical protein
MFFLHLRHVFGYTLLHHEIVEQGSFVEVGHAAPLFNFAATLCSI